MKRRRIIPVLLCMMLVLLGAGTAAGIMKEEVRNAAKGLRTALEGKDEMILNRQEILPAGSPQSDWAAMALALAGEKDHYQVYAKNLETYVKETYERNGSLSDRKATEYDRVILTVLALGRDPEQFGGADLVEDGIWQYQGGSLGDQGVNGWIYSLIAADAGPYEEPQDAKYTREMMVEEILAEQNEDGSFGLQKGSADPDLTAMALQALAPYQEDSEVKAASDEALVWLSEHMTEHGSYVSYGEESAESCAQTVIALCALGTDPAEDDRFAKNGVTLLDGMEAFARNDGGYAHAQSDRESNFMASEQVLLAKTALLRLRQGEERLYSFEQYTGPQESGTSMMKIVIAVIAAVAAGAVVLAVRRKGKTNAGADRTDSK